MKVVIDIDDEKYKCIVAIVKSIRDEIAKQGYATHDTVALGWTAIADGTVLPDGHGDLIDRSKIVYFRCPNNVKDCSDSVDFACQTCDFGIANRFRIDAMPAVISADKEKEDEDSNI